LRAANTPLLRICRAVSVYRGERTVHAPPPVARHFFLIACVCLPVAAIAPRPPQNLTATVNGNTVTLAWQNPSTGGVATTFVVEAALSPSGAVIASLPVVGTQVVVPAVPNGVYYVRVRGINSDGTGEASNEVVVSKMPRPAPRVAPATSATFPLRTIPASDNRLTFHPASAASNSDNKLPLVDVEIQAGAKVLSRNRLSSLDEPRDGSVRRDSRLLE
jgi:hypothetical protein